MIINFTTYIRSIFIVSIFSFIGINSNAQVGIETEDPKNFLDVNGAISLRESELVLTEGIYNANISLDTTPYSLYKVTGPTSVFAISGIIPITGADGQMVILQNATDATMLIAHENTFSSSANRILVAEEKDFYVRGKDASVTLQYNASQSRWVLLNKLNHAETWYTDDFIRFRRNRKTTVTITDPDIKSTSGVSINLVNNHGYSDAIKFNVIVEYIETQDGQFIFRVNNKNFSRVSLQYAFTINY